MKHIAMDDHYTWFSCSEEVAEAQIPDDMHQELVDAATFHNNVCHKIMVYLQEHPQDNLSNSRYPTDGTI